MALAPELQVLMATVREDLPRLHAALEQGVNWDLLATLAVREHATIALNRCVSRVRNEAAPPPVDPAMLSSLAAGALRHELRLVVQDQVIDALLTVFSDAGLDVVLLKGLAFQKAFCVSSRDRPSGDMDILLTPAEADRAWRLAQENGWQIHGEFPVEQYARHHHLPPLVDKIGLRLEIHTRLLSEPNPYGFDPDSVRRNARPLADRPGVLVPNPEDLLLHAAIHFAWSNTLKSGAWKTFRDINTLVEHQQVDWDRFVEIAGHHCRGPAVYWTLNLARIWAGIEVPGQVLDSLKPRRSAFLMKVLERHFATAFIPASNARGPGRSLRLNHKLFEFGLRPASGSERWNPPWESAWCPRTGQTGKHGVVKERPGGARDQARRASREFLYLVRLLIGR